jgi:predicted dehydrogenase
MINKLSRRELLKQIGLAAGSTLPLTSLAVPGITLPMDIPETEYIRLDKPVTVITIGAGNRGNVYGDYAIQYPENLDVVGVAEPINIRNERYASKHKIKPENRFQTWEDVFKKPKFADAVIISTPDNLHYGPCMAALKAGYHILLEKPISPSESECREILKLATKTGKVVGVCHVLRYAPYFVKLKEIMHSGKLGKVVSIQHFEPIGHVHMSHSYVRGNWHNSEKTTPIILAKSCHDLDILRWMLEKNCKKVSAFADLRWFKKENDPPGSTARCMDGCAVEKKCPYSALKIYHRDRKRLYVFDLPEDKTKHGDAILDYLKKTDYGRCVYKMDNDQPDHYTTNLLFDDNITASFSMEAFTSYEGRRTRIMGSLGDIVGDMQSMVQTDFLTGKQTTWKQTTDMHGGGDWRLAQNWVEAVSQQKPALLTSTLEASIESHIIGFMAEKSRKSMKTMDVEL